MKHVHSPTLRDKSGTVYRDAVSFVSASVSMRIQMITVHLGPNYIKPPMTENAVKDCVTNFFNRFSIPQCLGAIDGTNISIKQPQESSTDYIYHSLNVQACLLALFYGRCSEIARQRVRYVRMFANSKLRFRVNT